MNTTLDHPTAARPMPAAARAIPWCERFQWMALFRGIERPPLWFWLLPAMVALLRTLPILWLEAVPPPEGLAYAGVSYISKDFLAYLSFIRQTAEDGSLVYANPFTTDPQSPRFILLFHTAVGLLARVTGLSPNAAFEVSRLPLTFLFFAVLWWFVRPILAERKDRLWACALVAFAGGFESLYRALEGFLPPLPGHIATPFVMATQPLMGWSTFASFFNPMWIAALIVALLVLRPMLAPEGPRSRTELCVIALGVFILYWIHPYTAIGVLAIVFTLPVVESAAQRMQWRKVGKIAAALFPALILIALIGRWQSSGAVYRASSVNVFGSQEVPVFWYPLTLGALGFMALRGAKFWAGETHPWRFALLAWVIAIALLHSSPLINGYKFVFLLHLPVCIVAAGAVRRFFEQAGTGAGKGRSIVLGLCLFLSAPLLTLESLRQAETTNFVGADYMRMVDKMAKLPRGNAFVPPRLGNLLPAFTAHRVWVGQWFLTPNYEARSEWFDFMTNDRSYLSELDKVLADQQIQYVVVPSARSGALNHHLGDRIRATTVCGELTLLVLR